MWPDYNKGVKNHMTKTLTNTKLLKKVARLGKALEIESHNNHTLHFHAIEKGTELRKTEAALANVKVLMSAMFTKEQLEAAVKDAEIKQKYLTAKQEVKNENLKEMYNELLEKYTSVCANYWKLKNADND